MKKLLPDGPTLIILAALEGRQPATIDDLVHAIVETAKIPTDRGQLFSSLDSMCQRALVTRTRKPGATSNDEFTVTAAGAARLKTFSEAFLVLVDSWPGRAGEAADETR